MTNRHSSGHRDKNEFLFTELLRRAGVEYFLMTEGAGFDILVFLNPMICVEIKNPDVPKSDRQFTKTEAERQKLCKELGIPFFVFEQPEEMAKMLGHYRSTDKVF